MSIGACPKCGGRMIRESHVRDARESFLKRLGIAPFRCRHCGHRFTTWTFDYSTLRHAHCPRCLDPNLKGWSEPYLSVGWWNRLKVVLGARKYRCDRCRCNFASFRSRAPEGKEAPR